MADALRVGLLGAGGISGHHLRGFNQFPERLKLGAVCDIDAGNARKRAAEGGGAPVYAELEAMLRDADIDAVDICTIHAQHFEQVMACLAAGKHVLVEKPFATRLEDCRAMVAAAESAGKTLMVAQCQRYMPSYVAVRKLLREGKLGAVQAVRFDAHQNIRAFVGDDHWLLNGAQAGGGIVISVTVHRIDLMRFLVGDVKRVSAVGRSSSPAFKHDAEDFVAAVLEFENGAIGEMFGTYSGYRMPWGEMFMIFGDRGTIHAVPELGGYLGDAHIATVDSSHRIEGWEDQYSGFEPLRAHAGGLPSEDGFVNELLHFEECVRTGREPDSSGRDNIGTMKVVFGIYESLKTGQSVELAHL